MKHKAKAKEFNFGAAEPFALVGETSAVPQPPKPPTRHDDKTLLFDWEDKSKQYTA